MVDSEKHTQSLWLSDSELTELTGYSWKRKQQEALANMRIDFYVNPRGRILVKRSVVEGGIAPKARPAPNWSLIKRRAA